MPAIDALFLWIASLKLGMDWEITEPTFLTLEWIPNFWETYGFLWIDFWINKIQQKDWSLGFAFGSLKNFLKTLISSGLGWVRLNSTWVIYSVSNFSLYWLPCNKKTLGKTPGTRHFFPSTRHLKMGRFNKVWEWLSMQLAYDPGYDG